MKKLLLLPLVLFSMASCNEPKKGFGEQALNSAMTSTDGETIAFKDILAQYKGKPVVIEVWASWCSDCAKGMPKLHALQEQFPDMQYLFLSYDRDLDDWKQGIKKHNLNGGHYHVSKSMKEGAFAKDIELDWIPRYMVVDADGNIAHFKAIEADDPKLIATLKNLE